MQYKLIIYYSDNIISYSLLYSCTQCAYCYISKKSGSVTSRKVRSDTFKFQTGSTAVSFGEKRVDKSEEIRQGLIYFIYRADMMISDENNENQNKNSLVSKNSLDRSAKLTEKNEIIQMVYSLTDKRNKNDMDIKVLMHNLYNNTNEMLCDETKINNEAYELLALKEQLSTSYTFLIRKLDEVTKLHEQCCTHSLNTIISQAVFTMPSGQQGKNSILPLYVAYMFIKTVNKVCIILYTYVYTCIGSVSLLGDNKVNSTSAIMQVEQVSHPATASKGMSSSSSSSSSALTTTVNTATKPTTAESTTTKSTTMKPTTTKLTTKPKSISDYFTLNCQQSELNLLICNIAYNITSTIIYVCI